MQVSQYLSCIGADFWKRKYTSQYSMNTFSRLCKTPVVGKTTLWNWKNDKWIVQTPNLNYSLWFCNIWSHMRSNCWPFFRLVCVIEVKSACLKMTMTLGMNGKTSHPFVKWPLILCLCICLFVWSCCDFPNLSRVRCALFVLFLFYFIGST